MIKDRFRKYLPVVIDLETGGFDSKTNAILEIAATLISENEKTQLLEVGETYRYHIEPYEGLIVEQESLDFTKIKLDHPLRNAISEKDALDEPFHPFSVLDTVSLGALHTKQTVLARICDVLEIEYDSKLAHSAAYDSDVTAKVFCKIINDFDRLKR
jgi:ribonuclease T